MKVEMSYTETDVHKILQDYKGGKDLCLTDACPTHRAICNICEICPLKNLDDKERLEYIFSHIYKEPMFWSTNVDDSRSDADGS